MAGGPALGVWAVASELNSSTIAPSTGSVNAACGRVRTSVMRLGVPLRPCRAGQNLRSMPVTVLAVDDQEVFRRAVRELLAAADGFEQVGEAGSGEEALALAAVLRPDLVLLDVRMPGMDGIETARRLAVLVPDAVVALISLEGLADLPSTITEVGAAEQIRKQDLSPQVLRDLWNAHGQNDQTS
jgi:CheY-like chemotaxis protein